MAQPSNLDIIKSLKVWFERFASEFVVAPYKQKIIEDQFERILTMQTNDGPTYGFSPVRSELIEWDVERPGQCSVAASRFIQLQRDGFRPYVANPDGSQGAPLDDFDMDLGRIFMAITEEEVQTRIAATKKAMESIEIHATRLYSPGGFNTNYYIDGSAYKSNWDTSHYKTDNDNLREDRARFNDNLTKEVREVLREMKNVPSRKDGE